MAIAAPVGTAIAVQSPEATKQEEKKRVVVLDFFYGNTSSPYWGSYSYSGRAAGVGISQKLIEGLLEDGSVRVADRSQIADRDYGEVSVSDAVTIGQEIGVDYVIIGTVTEFNVDSRSSGGSFMGIGGSSETNVATVELSVRVIDTATGDIVATARGEAETSSSGSSGSFRGIGGRSDAADTDGLLSDAVNAAVVDLVENLTPKL
jgi:curli biogenesis system outer membrane secretion channel CsgG